MSWLWGNPLTYAITFAILITLMSLGTGISIYKLIKNKYIYICIFVGIKPDIGVCIIFNNIAILVPGLKSPKYRKPCLIADF